MIGVLIGAALILGLVGLCCWVGGEDGTGWGRDTAMSGGGGHVDYGPLTEAEYEAHEDELREMEK